MSESKAKVWLSLVVVVALTTSSAHGQFFGKRTPPGPTVPPEQRVAELVKVLKEDGDENRRFDAVEELRGMDVVKHPEIVAALMNAMLNDKKPSVRSEAAYTVGRIRPVQQGIGTALEYLRDNDTSMRVRLQARGTLVGYYLSGYRSVKVEEPNPMLPTEATRKEPPLATGPSGIGSSITLPSTQAPPLVDTTGPRLTPTPTRAPTTVLPLGPQRQPGLVPVPPPVVVETPGTRPAQPLPQGPSLGPPQ